MVLSKSKNKNETQIETLYLLIAISQLGREYRLNLKVLCSYFNMTLKSDGSVRFNTDLNYFSITVLLFYIKDIKTYTPLLEELKKVILEKFKEGKKYGWKDNTELVFLFFDLLTCPYLDNKLNRNEEESLIEAASEVHNNLIEPILNQKLYIEHLKSSIINLSDSKLFFKINGKARQKILVRSNKYISELEKSVWIRKDIYLLEEQFANSIIDFKYYLKSEVDKYAFTKHLLDEVDIRENQITLIEQERFWFTKWTEFDFGLELQAKRSQEVY